MKHDFNVLVCGGRDFGWKVNSNRQKTVNKEEVEYLANKLDVLRSAIKEIGRNLIVIQGEAQGADAWAKKWADINNITTLDFPANWDAYGKGAGFIRNKQMLDEGKPDLVIAFRGGKGTAMMIDIAKKANVPVKEY